MEKNFLNQYLYDPWLEKTFIFLESNTFNRLLINIIFISAKYETYQHIHYFYDENSENKDKNLLDITTAPPFYLDAITHYAGKNLFGPFKFNWEEEIYAKLDTILLLK